jgi:hypothetical protein
MQISMTASSMLRCQSGKEGRIEGQRATRIEPRAGTREKGLAVSIEMSEDELASLMALSRRRAWTRCWAVELRHRARRRR